ncbi:CD3324 family protein [Paenibacillus sp. J5C_2022]|uniref:CD3324 family protein n=1 Tax=Paenibacillus sp. J5C2022 TaxID=2977129 RepID=UPI0021D33FEF|nr:CD3324 family protein [Paenibacillus sp. J5C2022]MCU6708139.1 CD3324 family protein [Paenibacillus sp. J5C2022]
MNYRNGRDVLPPSLLAELQQYIQGDLIYIPKPSNQRASWGEKSGARKLLAERNREIYKCYADGATISELERKFHLSSESIRKIIVKVKCKLTV